MLNSTFGGSIRNSAAAPARRLPLDDDNQLYQAPTASVDLTTEDADDVMAAYLGSRNGSYYLRVFKKFESGGGILSWNWAAFFCTAPWLLYRRLWIWFFVFFLGLPLVAFTVGTISIVIHPLFGLAVFIFMYFCLAPIFANFIFYRRALQHVSAAKKTSPRLATQISAAERIGGTNEMGAWIFGVIVYSLFTAGLVFSVIPAIRQLGAELGPAPKESVQQYDANRQIEAAVNVSIEARQQVELYYLEHSRYPLNDKEARLPTMAPHPYIETIYIDAGRVAIVFGETAATELRNESLFMIPTHDGARFSWSCDSSSIEWHFLPTRCRL
ncbi:MAG: pilin [Pseudomonadota bacterium]